LTGCPPRTKRCCGTHWAICRRSGDARAAVVLDSGEGIHQFAGKIVMTALAAN
jgi:hypothetical protein